MPVFLHARLCVSWKAIFSPHELPNASLTQNGITQISLVYFSLPQTKKAEYKEGEGEGKSKNKKKRRVAAYIRKKRMTRFLVLS